MSVVAKKMNKRKFEPAPEGAQPATLKEVKDLGEVDTSYGAKSKVRFDWELDEVNADGYPYLVFERFTNTLSARGRLAPRIKSLTGEMPDENEDYDLSSLEGTRVTLVIEHNVDAEGTTWANVAAVVRQKTEAEEAEEARVKKVASALKQRNAPVVAAGEPDPDPITDEDIPF
jgi:hypothetical protein